MTRLEKLRKRYIEHPSRVTLRLYLIAKARRGMYDPRMFKYYNQSSNVNDACKRATVRAYARGLVPTDTLRPVGSSGSYHAQRNFKGEGMAVDFGNIESYAPGGRNWSKGKDRLLGFQREEHAAYHRGHRARLVELIGPNNFLVVLRDAETNLPEGIPLENQHDNHVHQAYIG